MLKFIKNGLARSRRNKNEKRNSDELLRFFSCFNFCINTCIPKTFSINR